MKCDICPETRGIQKSHIISRKLDFVFKDKLVDLVSAKEVNTLYLCPNHHWYFDHNLLTDQELGFIKVKIKWAIKAYKAILEHYQSLVEHKNIVDLVFKDSRKDILWNKTLNRLNKEGFLEELAEKNDNKT